MMALTPAEYTNLVKHASPPSPLWKNVFRAFLAGGLICAFGEGLFQIFEAMDMPERLVRSLVPLTLVFLAVVTTGFDIYDNIAKFAGAGTLVPITGFANAMASSAIEFKTEGMVLGVGAKMFQVAGPVIVYGVTASVLYGVILWLFRLF